MKLRDLLLFALLGMTSLTFAQSHAPDAIAPELKVGDKWKYRVIDLWNDKELRTYEREVLKTTETGYNFQVKRSDREQPSRYATTKNLNTINDKETPPEIKIYEFPLQIGKKWKSLSYSNNGSDGNRTNLKYKTELDREVLAFEKVKTPAGEFDAYKIGYSGFWTGIEYSASGRQEGVYWYAPKAKQVVKQEYKDYFGGSGNGSGRINNQARDELIEYKVD